jgi:protein-S-isoprenylcysteine O-methyltransferase Ste14
MNDKLYPKFLVFLQFGLIGLMILFSHGILNSIPGMLLFSLGLILGLWALNHNKRGNFNIQPKLKDGCHLVTSGAYKYIRHPMYTSVILMMLGVLVSTPTLLEFLLFIALIIVLVLKAKREEKLWCGHDEAYIEYKRETKLFIPYIL